MKDALFDYWNTVKFDEKLAPQESHFFNQFLTIAKNSKRILEIGVGNGRMINLLRKNGVKSHFSAVDIVKAKLSGVDFTVADARHLPFKDNSYDLVYSLGVIEHFKETKLAVQEHVRVLKKGGYLLITTPKLSFNTPLRYLLYLIRGNYKNGPFRVVCGNNFRLGQIKKMFNLNHVKIIKLEGIGDVFPLQKRAKLWDKFLKVVLPMKLFGDYLYCIIQKI